MASTDSKNSENAGISEAQKSEVHGVTGDASTSPQSAEDRESTRAAIDKRSPEGQHVNPDIRASDVTIVKDETDDGGPLVIETSDPDLQAPRVEDRKGQTDTSV